MKQLSISLVGLTLMATSTATTVVGETSSRNCAARDLVLERLSSSYGETRQSIGLGTNNAVIETFASKETGTWTITVTMPNGTTCMIASGQAFEQLAEEKLAGNDTET